MAHGINNNDKMAYFGAVPWHGLGTKLASLATAAEMIEAAGLNWEVTKDEIFDADMAPISRFRATRRSDTREVLGIVGTGYQPLQNVEAFEMLDKITMDPNGPKYETAGSLWNGRQVWALARMPEWREVAKGDEVGQYLLISNSHDGSTAVRVLPTSVRVVCANTLGMALGKAKGARAGWTGRHSSGLTMRYRDVAEVLGLLGKQFESSTEAFKLLAKKTPTDAQVKAVLEGLFPDTEKGKSGQAKREKVMELAETGIGNDRKVVRGTAWALYNGITEMEDHGLTPGMRGDENSRLNRLWFGEAVGLKEKALDALLAL